MDANALMQLFVYVLIVGVVVAIGLYVLAKSPIPEPYKGWIRWGILAVIAIFVMFWLLGFVGPLPKLRG